MYLLTGPSEDTDNWVLTCDKKFATRDSLPMIRKSSTNNSSRDPICTGTPGAGRSAALPGKRAAPAKAATKKGAKKPAAKKPAAKKAPAEKKPRAKKPDDGQSSLNL